MKHADAQDDWPIRSIPMEKEAKTIDVALNYQENNLSFEIGFAFWTSWNTSMTTMMRHDDVEKVNYEDVRVNHDDGPCRNFSDIESRSIFGCMPIEPAMDDQIKAHGSKKNSEKRDVVGGCRHVQVERCFMFSWWALTLCRVHEYNVSNFDFYVDKNVKHDHDVKLFFSRHRTLL